jgi:hypothetical protein
VYPSLTGIKSYHVIAAYWPVAAFPVGIKILQKGFWLVKDTLFVAKILHEKEII